MSDIVLTQVGAYEQSQFFDRVYSEFLCHAVYGYLVEGLNLRQIEARYLGNDGLEGSFSKAVLNSMGIDTSNSSGNRGRYSGCNVDDVVKSLISSGDSRLANIGKALSRIPQRE